MGPNGQKLAELAHFPFSERGGYFHCTLDTGDRARGRREALSSSVSVDSWYENGTHPTASERQCYEGPYDDIMRTVPYV